MKVNSLLKSIVADTPVVDCEFINVHIAVPII